MPGPDTIDYRRDRCNGCGRCIERCPFDANRLLDGGCIDIDMSRCYGCGICVPTCPRGARRLVQREGYSSQFYPLEFVKNGGQQRDQEHLLCEIRNR